MLKESQQQVTKLLNQWSDGNEVALEKLMPLVYDELRSMARRYMSGQKDRPTFQTTELIHEAYLKIAGNNEQEWNNRSHFFGVAAKAMRHILIDHARSLQTNKRAGANNIVSFEEGNVISPERASEFIALDDALNKLEKLDERKARIVEMRYIGGLTVAEVAEVLQISPTTISRDWNFSKTWLLRELANK